MAGLAGCCDVSCLIVCALLGLSGALGSAIHSRPLCCAWKNGVDNHKFITSRATSIFRLEMERNYIDMISAHEFSERHIHGEYELFYIDYNSTLYEIIIKL